MKTLSAVQLAWLAGFFDGEGCISIFHIVEKPTQLRPKGRTRYALQISITNTSVSALALVHTWFGGKLYKHSRGCWVWKLCGRNLQRDFLQAVQSYLHIKSAQAAIALEYLATVIDDKTYGYCPLTPESEAIRKSCFERASAEKDKYSTKGAHRRSNVKIPETAGTPERAICNQASIREEGSETIIGTPKGDGIVRHSKELEITGRYGHKKS